MSIPTRSDVNNQGGYKLLVRLTEENGRRLKTMAKRTFTSRNAVINQAISMFDALTDCGLNFGGFGNLGNLKHNLLNTSNVIRNE